MGYVIEEMALRHYDQAMALWRSTNGVRISQVDSKENIKRFLERNPSLSYAAMDGSDLIGAVLGSHDGRQGYLTHLAVDPNYRRQGIGRSLVGRCLYAFMSIGINKCMLLIMENDQVAVKFCQDIAQVDRVDMLLLSQVE